MKGYFLNSRQAACSIHEQGRDVFDLLEDFGLRYFTDPGRFLAAIGTDRPDFVIVNYHHTVNKTIDKRYCDGVPTLAFHWECRKSDPLAGLCKQQDWDAICVPDPTFDDRDNIFSFPRPVPWNLPDDKERIKVPVIGFLGFATRGKFPDEMAKAIGDEFEEVVVRLHIPAGTYVKGDADKFIADFKEAVQRHVKQGTVEVNQVYLTKPQLIKWVEDLNLLIIHYRRDIPGLAAVPDLAVAAMTPFSVSDCDTFRHVFRYQSPYPQRSLKESMLYTLPLGAMRCAWSRERFVEKFHAVLGKLNVKERQ